MSAANCMSTVREVILKRLRINERNGCWEWTVRNGERVSSSYGKISVRMKRWQTHRLMYVVSCGPIPDGMRVLHRCDNPPCCNPAHLFLGTDADNVADMVAKGRGAKGDKSGSRIHREVVAAANRKRAKERPETVTFSGESHGCAKLTWGQVNEIRRRYAAAKATGRRYCPSGGNLLDGLANEFKVSRSQLKRIVRGTNWTCLSRTVPRTGEAV